MGEEAAQRRSEENRHESVNHVSLPYYRAPYDPGDNLSTTGGHCSIGVTEKESSPLIASLSDFNPD